jgi:hypothetical protein
VSTKTTYPALSRSERRVLLGVGILLLVCLSAYLLLRIADNAIDSLNEAKKVRTTTAVVKAKDYVRFDEGNYSYVNDLGKIVEMPRGAEQWRLYYQIDNFDQVPEPKRSELWRSEDARVKQFGFRFYPMSAPDKIIYEKAQVGDQLEVRYRYIADDKEIIGVRNLSHP